MERLYYYTLDPATGRTTGPMDHWEYQEREINPREDALTGAVEVASDTVAPGVQVRTYFTGRTVNEGTPFECQVRGLPLEERRTAGCFRSRDAAVSGHERTVRELREYFERVSRPA